MSDLDFIEKTKLETVLGMGSGYVLNFTNYTFEQFVTDSVSREIANEKYSYRSGSKANRLRAFWKIEPNHIVGKLLADLLKYGYDYELIEDNRLYEECKRITARLLENAVVPEIDAITPNADDTNFEKLAKSIRNTIEQNEPEQGLDRLHTFVVRYVRILCAKHDIDTPRDKPLHSLFGEYVKKLMRDGVLESEMTKLVMKSSISILERFNTVRNDHSWAHDNPILNYNESLYIFNSVSSMIRFITNLETELDRIKASEARQTIDDDDLPF